MMSQLEESLESLLKMWPGVVSADVVAEYAKRLARVDPHLLAVAVDHFVNTSTSSFRPTVGQIRRRIAEATCGFPTEDTAWRQALAYDLWRDQKRIQGDDWDEPFPDVHPTVVHATRAAGVNHQGSWLKVWRSEVDRWTEQTAAQPDCLPPETLTATRRQLAAPLGFDGGLLSGWEPRALGTGDR